MPEAPATPDLRPGFLTAGLAVCLAIAVSGATTLLAQGAGDTSVAGLLRAAVQGWLVALGSGLEVEGTAIGLIPLGATMLCVLVVALAARWVVAKPIEEVGPFAATVAGSYGVAAAVLSAVTNTGDVNTSVVRAAFGAFVVGGIGAAVGASLKHDRPEMLWFTDRLDVRAVVRGAWWGTAALLGSAAVLVVVLLVVQLDRAADLWAMLDPGSGGTVVLAITCLLAVPTLVLWATSVLLGPGFVLGTDTSVDLTGSHLGAVPGFPPLAALPAPGEFHGWVFVLGLLPLLAGVVAGFRMVPVPANTSTHDQKDADSERALLDRVILGTASGALAGFIVGLAVSVSGGGIGPGRMADAGPPFITPLLVAVPVMAVGGAAGAVLAHYRGERAPQPTERSPDSSSRRPRLRFWHQSPSADRRDERPDDGA
ncbi:cell division protein PerM [Aeromicrobium sp.]|uniref:cell division protein PerM n=1 Tax=Aeromicrobium sp. TaxID=1871063 RepID=UPI003D6A5C41